MSMSTAEKIAEDKDILIVNDHTGDKFQHGYSKVDDDEEETYYWTWNSKDGLVFRDNFVPSWIKKFTKSWIDHKELPDPRI